MMDLGDRIKSQAALIQKIYEAGLKKSQNTKIYFSDPDSPEIQENIRDDARAERRNRNDSDYEYEEE